MDALNFPDRLVEKANRSRRSFPEGWKEEAIKQIPDKVFQKINPQLTGKLAYATLKNRPWRYLQKLPHSAPFWLSWAEKEGLTITTAFIARVKRQQQEDAGNMELEQLTDAEHAFHLHYDDTSDGDTIDEVDEVPAAMDSNIRHGSYYDIQHRSTNLGAKAAPFPASQQLSGLDLLVHASSVIESGTADLDLAMEVSTTNTKPGWPPSQPSTNMACQSGSKLTLLHLL